MSRAWSPSVPTLSETPDRAVQLRRLRASLGASADAVLSRGADPARLLEEEVAFLTAICGALNGSERLIGIWRELRNRALTLAADMPPTEQSLGVLRARLASDDAQAGTRSEPAQAMPPA